MANAEHVELVKKGWGAVRDFFRKRMSSEQSGGWLDLRGIDLSDAELRKRFQGATDFCWVDFTDANLQNVCVSKGNLWENKFSSANLSGANFKESELCYSEFDYADCTNANFSEADLSGAFFCYADLTATDLSDACCEETSFIGATFNNSKLNATRFSGAGLGYTHFINADLSHALGLDEAEHYALSYLDEQTLTYSKGHVPDSFLIGCGYSDQRGCFVLSSFNDEEFDTQLRNNLRNRKFPCWLIRKFPNYYPRDSRDDRVDITKNGAAEAILIVCSQQSLSENHILLDIEQILDAESDTHVVRTLPVVTDNYCFDEWQHPLKQQLLNRPVIDFRNWREQDAFANSLDRLIRDLQAEKG